MKEQIGLKPREKELLRFVMPIGEYTVELDKNRYGSLRQTCTRTSDGITIHETHTMFPDAHTEFFYTLEVDGGDLIVRSLTERTCLGETSDYPSGYPYIKLPQDNTLITWQYEYCEDTTVFCFAELNKTVVDGKIYEALTVLRIEYHKGENCESIYAEKELYLAGHGIISKKGYNLDNDEYERFKISSASLN